MPSGYESTLIAFATRLGFPVAWVGQIGGRDSTLGQTVYHPRRRIKIRADMTPAARFRVLTHECAHAMVETSRGHNCGLMTDTSLPMEVSETIAEATAALVTTALRVSNHAYSVSYLADWSRVRTNTEGAIVTTSAESWLVSDVRDLVVILAKRILKNFPVGE